MRRIAIAAVSCLALSAGVAFAETAQERLKEASDVFQEIMATPDKGIPQDLLDKANCIVIVPDMKKAAFGIGGQYGRGFATCRNANGHGWGAPAAVRMEGGSFGFQIGATSTDLVMLVMNKRGMNRLLEDKFTLGADASAAAGPVGRDAKASTDVQMSAEILAWSRSKGLFAGVSLNGTTMRNDLDENQELYGKKLTNSEVLEGKVKAPASASAFLATLDKYSPVEEGSNADRSAEPNRK
jgi:SH3 domain-containing YSC84-like protein 1